jgi:hypothetical protein
MKAAPLLVLAVLCAGALTGCGMENGPSVARNVDVAPPKDLRGDTRNAIAWAPLADPDDIVVEGSVPSSRAWSTSKVLVIAAYLDVVVDGDPDKIPADVGAMIRAALTRSDDSAIIEIRRRVPDVPRVMSSVLRAIGDTRTKVPEGAEGTMQWGVREQVRFMAAVGNGRVVSPEASAFLLREMQPIASQRWGLGIIGARAFKPGWMDAHSESRQMGIVGDFAVAIITTHGPGGNAHTAQLNRLALLLAPRIEEARCLRSSILGWDARWC